MDSQQNMTSNGQSNVASNGQPNAASIHPDTCSRLLLNGLTSPAVFKGMIQDWSACTWDIKTLSTILGDQPVQIRIGPKSLESKAVLWERDCCFEEATVQDFLEWLDQGHDADSQNPLKKYSPSDMWAYADYKYMSKMFEEQPEILKAVSWDMFGFPGRDGAQSTLWIGSAGAHTPCHYDTYGYNLVAQIMGRKRWYLFPPASSMYPTRVPYEESSVFSEVNIKNPDLDKFKKFKNVQPYIVTLHPGEVLFVPKQWWHFVESLDTTISVNTWIELPSDEEVRFHEAIVRILVASLMQRTGEELTSWLNPTELEDLKGYSEDLKINHDEDMDYMNRAIVDVKRLRAAGEKGPTVKRKAVEHSGSREKNTNSSSVPEGKKLKMEPNVDTTSLTCLSCDSGLDGRTDVSSDGPTQCNKEQIVDLELSGTGSSDSVSHNFTHIGASEKKHRTNRTSQNVMPQETGEILEKYQNQVELIHPKTFLEYLEIIKYQESESESESDSLCGETETDTKCKSKTDTENEIDTQSGATTCATKNKVSCDSEGLPEDTAVNVSRGKTKDFVNTVDLVNVICNPEVLATISKHLLEAKNH